MYLRIWLFLISVIFFENSCSASDTADATGADERAVIRGLAPVGTISGLASIAINSSSAGNDYESLKISDAKVSSSGEFFRWDGTYAWAIVNDGTNVYRLRTHDLTATGYGSWSGGNTDGSGAGRYFLDFLVSTPGVATTYNYQTGQSAVTGVGLRFTLTQGTSPIAVLSITDVLKALNTVAPGKTAIAANGTDFGKIGSTNWSASARWYTTGFTTPADGTETGLSTAAAVTIFPTQAAFTFSGKVPNASTVLTFTSNPVTLLDAYVSGSVGSPITFYNKSSGETITATFNLAGFLLTGGPSTQIVRIINSIKRVNHQFPIAPGRTPTSASPMAGLLSAFNGAAYAMLPALLNNMLAITVAHLPSFAGSANYHVGMVAGPGNAEEFRVTTAISGAGTILTIIGDWYDNQSRAGRKVGNSATLTCDLASISSDNFLGTSNTVAPALSGISGDTIFPIGPSVTRPAVFLFRDVTNGYALALYAATGVSMGAQTIGSSGVVAAHATAIATQLTTDNIFAAYSGATTGSMPNVSYIGCIKPVSLKRFATGSD